MPPDFVLTLGDDVTVRTRDEDEDAEESNE